MMKKILLLAFILFASVPNLMAEDADSLYAKDLLKPGTQAPEFILDFDDTTQNVPLSRFRGSYVVLDFWASWCPDCRKDIPLMKALYDSFNASGVQFIGISFDTSKEAWQKCIKDNDMSWLQYSELKKWKKETKIDQDYHVNWIPTMYLLDPDGKVVLGTVELEKLKAKLEELREVDKIVKVEQMPSFPGGYHELMNYLATHIQYPKVLAKQGLEGGLVMDFTVGEDGSISNIQASKVSLTRESRAMLKKYAVAEQEQITHDALLAFSVEAYRVVKNMPAWKPGLYKGKPVKVRYHLPVNFRLR